MNRATSVVRRSRTRLVLQWVAGAVLVLAALDIMWLHVVSIEPSRLADGTLDQRGQTSRRLDVVWGGLLLAAGVGTMAAAGVVALRDRPLVSLRPDGILVLLSGPGDAATLIPWDAVRSVRSTLHEDETGKVRAIALELQDASMIPKQPWNATWGTDGRLYVDADGWSLPAAEVAMAAQLELERRATADRRGPDHPVAGGDEEP